MTSRDILTPGSQSFIAAMRDIIDPDIAFDTGHEGTVYGTYVDWGDLSHYDEDVLLGLLDYFGIGMPFGQAVDIRLELGRLYREKYGIDISMPDGETASLEFPSLGDLRQQVEGLLKTRGVPQGVVYEADMSSDYPDDMRYWPTKDDEEDDFAFLQGNPLSLEAYLSGVRAIRSEYDSACSGTVKCALILSALVHAEYYLQSTITMAFLEKSLELSGVLNIQGFKKMMQYQIKKPRGREDLYRLFFGESPKPLPMCDLRNSLAHSITRSRIESGPDGDEIVFQTKDGEESKERVEKVFEKLLKYRCNGAPQSK